MFRIQNRCTCYSIFNFHVVRHIKVNNVYIYVHMLSLQNVLVLYSFFFFWCWNEQFFVIKPMVSPQKLCVQFNLYNIYFIQLKMNSQVNNVYVLFHGAGKYDIVQ